MLETHGLQVDTAESGEQALDYLRGARPDVVFMDHLMPGMDGFEAVRAIKSNTQTAAIPVVMYTSQEGERYLQEARKVGALGVLSKTLKPTDVSRALYELNLLPDRRELQAGESASVSREQSRAAYAPHNMSANSPIAPPPRPVQVELGAQPAVAAAQSKIGAQDLHATVTALVNEQHAELQQLLQSDLDAMSNRLSAEMRATAQQIALSSGPDDAAANGTRGWFAAALLLVALIPTAVIAALYWRTLDDNQAQLEQSTSRLAMVVTDQQTQIEQLRAELRRRQDTEFPAASHNDESIAVPYGELPLAKVRTQRLQALLERLQAEGFRGKLRVSSFAADFCLTGTAINGYKLASDELPARRCDLIGNPFDDGLTAAQRQSPEFANAIASASGKVRIEVFTEGRKPAVAYPPHSDSLTAGEWNRIAARNNRVEFSAVAPE
jgi:CheY-like chemotaxis protein